MKSSRTIPQCSDVPRFRKWFRLTLTLAVGLFVFIAHAVQPRDAAAQGLPALFDRQSFCEAPFAYCWLRSGERWFAGVRYAPEIRLGTAIDVNGYFRVEHLSTDLQALPVLLGFEFMVRDNLVTLHLSVHRGGSVRPAPSLGMRFNSPEGVRVPIDFGVSVGLKFFANLIGVTYTYVRLDSSVLGASGIPGVHAPDNSGFVSFYVDPVGIAASFVGASQTREGGN